MVCTLRGIHTFRKKNRNTQIIRCSSWGTKVKPFPISAEENDGVPQAKTSHCHPFATRSYPSRPKPFSFAKRQKATPIKRSNPVSRPHKDKLSKPRKINVRYHPEFMQWNQLAIVKAKEVEAIEQAPTLTLPATASATPVQPMEASATQSQKSPKYCAICTPTGNFLPTEYPIPIKADWSEDSEEKKETQRHNKDKDNFSDIENVDGELEKWKNLAVQDLKNNDNQTPNQASNPHPHLILRLLPFSPPNTLLISLETKLVYHQHQEGQKETFEDFLRRQ